MTSTNGNRLFLSAWGISLALHGVVVALALAFVAQVKPVLQEDIFQWDVALVQEAGSDFKSEPVKSAMASEQSLAKKALPTQIKPVLQVSQTIPPIENKNVPPQPPIETVLPIEPKVESPQLRDEPVEQRRVEVAESKAEPALESKESEPIAVPALPEPVEAHSAQREAVAGPSAPTLSPEVPPLQEGRAQVLSSTSDVDLPALQMAKAPASDHRWLAESLWRRVAELKRYPNLARMNGQEGKVILKAVIRSDGQLADVFVQESSGYSALDEAAMEAVRLACPLYMKHAIGKPQIVVSIPIVYSLVN